MAPNGPQIPLPLDHDTGGGREDFISDESNALALGWIDRWPEWPDPLLIVSGPPGSGKTHLARIWAARAGARVLEAAGLTEAAVNETPAPPALVVENLETLRDERALFHLMNRTRQSATPLLMTSRVPPASLDIVTPDLMSRLRAAAHAPLSEPSPALLIQLLARLFDARGIHASPEMLDYMANRMDRSAAAARDWVARVDDFALRYNRRLNMTLIREIMGAA